MDDNVKNLLQKIKNVAETYQLSDKIVFNIAVNVYSKIYNSPNDFTEVLSELKKTIIYLRGFLGQENAINFATDLAIELSKIIRNKNLYVNPLPLTPKPLTSQQLYSSTPVSSQSSLPYSPFSGVKGYSIPPSPSGSGQEQIQLRSNQIEDVQFHINCFKNSFFSLDHSPMGTGKTFIASYLGKSMNFKNMIVICPNGLIETWKSFKVRFNLPISSYNNENLILSYDSLRGTTKSKSLKHGLLIRQGDEFYPSQILYDLVREGCFLVFDEYQKLKDTTTLTSKAATVIIAAFKHYYDSGSSSRVLLMSGTPFSKEDEVISFYKLTSICHTEKLSYYNPGTGEYILDGYAYEDIRSYFDRHFPGAVNKVLEIVSFSPDVKTLRSIIYKLYVNYIVPNFSYAMQQTEITFDLDAKNEFYDVSAERQPEVNELRNKLQKTVGNAEKGSVVKLSKQGLQEFIETMKKLEFIKIEPIIRNTIRILQTVPHSKVFIVANFTSTLKILYEKLAAYNPLALKGGVNVADRAARVNAFNEPNDNNRLIIANIKVASLGLSLHDTNGGFPRFAFIFPNFSFIDSYQAIFRVYRTGTMSQPHVTFVYLKDTPQEEKILDSYARKSTVTKEITETNLKFPGDFPNVYSQELNPYYVPYDYIEDEEPEAAPLLSLNDIQNLRINEL